MTKVKIIVLAIKILIPVLAVMFISFARKKKTKDLLAAIAVILTAAVLGAAVSGMIPSLQEKVTITALGEKGENSKSDEVFISGFTVNGSKVKVEKVIEGKWFYNGDRYCWRNENDHRKPGDLTRSVTLSIPVGFNRTINFVSSEYRGLAKVEYQSFSCIVDTSIQAKVEIENSSRILLLANEGIRLSVFLFVIIIATLLLNAAYKQEEKTTSWVKKHQWPLLYAAIAFCQLLYAIYHSGIDGLWVDELVVIGFDVQNPNLLGGFTTGDVPVPLSGLVSRLIYYAMPYGEQWLLLPGEIFTALGIFITAMCVRQFADEKAGAISALSIALSGVVLKQCSFEFRIYPFFFFFSALYLFFHIKRLQHPGKESYREIAILSLSMTLFANTHYHAVITCVALFIPDLYMLIKQRIRSRCLIPYCVAALSYIPILWTLIKHPKNAGFSWQEIPGFGNVAELIHYLTSDSRIAFILLSIGFVFGIIVIYLKNRDNTLLISSDYQINPHISFHIAFVLCFSILFFVVYGNWINTKATMWSERYFIDLIPYSAALIGVGASAFTSLPVFKTKRMQFLALSCIVLILFESTLPNLEKGANYIHEPYREAVEWLYAQNEIFKEDTLVLMGNKGNDDNTKALCEGINAYYITRQGQRDGFNLSTINSTDDMGKYNTVFVLYLHNNAVPQSIESALEPDFEKSTLNKSLKIQKYIRKKAE